MKATRRTGRRALMEARTVVIKVGSGALAENADLFDSLATQVAALRSQGRQAVIVSSGAVALGWKRLGYRRRPREIDRVQASAAAGQSLLMQRYQQAFEGFGLCVAQVLLTRADLSNRESLNNARAALAALMAAGAVPIINENDTVSTQELCFGDNDQLAAMVSPLVGADVLILLSTVEGVLDEHGKRIPSLSLSDEVVALSEAGVGHGTGGILSKVSAARKACRAGAHALVASAREPSVITRILDGQDLGTLFEPAADVLRARKHWIAYTLQPRGAVLVDAGAAAAVVHGGKSLLPIGVIGVRGQFDPGDAVRIIGPEGEVGRGLSRLSSADVARISGMSRDGGHTDEAGEAFPVLVHKDDLVVLGGG